MLRQWWTTTVPGLASSLSLSSTMMASWWEVCTHALHMSSIMCCCKVTLCTGAVGERIVHSLPPKPTSRSIYWRSLVWSSRERERGTSTSSTRCLLDYLRRRRHCWSWMIPANTGCVATQTSGSDLAAPTQLIFNLHFATRCLVGTVLDGAVTPEVGKRFREIRDSLQAIGFSKEVCTVFHHVLVCRSTHA